MSSRLGIATRLWLLVALLLAAMAAIGAHGAWELRQAHARNAGDVARMRELMDVLDDVRTAQIQFGAQLREFDAILLRGEDPALLEQHRSAFEVRAAHVERNLSRARGVMQKAGIAAAPAEEVARLHREITGDYLHALERYVAGRPESAAAVEAGVRGKDAPLGQKMEALIEGLEAWANGEQERLLAASAAGARRVAVLQAGVFALVLALSVALAALLVASVRRPLREVIGAAMRIADGDLALHVHVSGRDEAGRLMASMAGMTERLRALVQEVARRADVVDGSSVQVAQGHLDLSQRTEQQATTLEETASQMEELTSTVAQNADNAREASRIADEAAALASRGGAVVGQVVETMARISQSSGRIADITGVIDSIAFQTNILALNAAVESARAGEEGRGFAVVAGEVRELALRSADAAREIKSLIAASGAEVQGGAQLVAAAGRTIADIVAAVQQVNALVAEIASASREQSAGIEQVNTAVTAMDQVVQQNAALVEQATAATDAMREQARALLEAVGRFRLAEAPGG